MFFQKYSFQCNCCKIFFTNIIFVLFEKFFRVINMVKNKKIFDVFLREKPSMMLVQLLTSNSEMYASTLAKNVDCTYSHVVKILQEMEDAGLVTFEKTGRLKILKLTKKGEEVAKHIDAIDKLL